MVGRLGVGVTASSSLGEVGEMGLLVRDSEWVRREGFFFTAWRSSEDGPVGGVCDPSEMDMSLVRGEGGMTVTLGLIDSLSVS